jgi:hypothetical protein
VLTQVACEDRSAKRVSIQDKGEPDSPDYLSRPEAKLVREAITTFEAATGHPELRPR